MEDPIKDKEPSIEYYPILKEYDYIFGEFPGFPPKRDIDLSIELMHGSASMSKIPYRISTL
jgi:hypothetical protein